MLIDSTITANIPASDLKRAREFYADKLGLTPTNDFQGMFLVYTTSSGSQFSVYETQYAGQAEHTVAQWHVDDVDEVVRELKSRGVAFEQYDDMPGVSWNDGVASMEGMGKAAWFKDSENNTLCVDSGFPNS
jgi:predicted enzyme related to lactoylglutathione lyase